MHIVLLKNKRTESSKKAFEFAHTFLLKQNVEVTCFDEEDDIPPDSAPRFDVAMTFGGDGTLLHAVHRFGRQAPPMVGVNVGSLGFLAELGLEDLEKALEAICQQKYSVNPLLMLDLIDEKGGSHFAVNEVAIHRETTHNIIDLSVHVDGELFNTFSSDGLILATPTGSTAYSLAAGGPIIVPTLDAILITPICPHTISNRPVVIPARSTIQIELTRGADSAGIALDGTGAGKLSLHKKCKVSISSHRFRLLSFPSYNYFKTVREKLNWSGSLKKS